MSNYKIILVYAAKELQKIIKKNVKLDLVYEKSNEKKTSEYILKKLKEKMIYIPRVSQIIENDILEFNIQLIIGYLQYRSNLQNWQDK